MPPPGQGEVLHHRPISLNAYFPKSTLMVEKKLDVLIAHGFEALLISIWITFAYETCIHLSGGYFLKPWSCYFSLNKAWCSVRKSKTSTPNIWKNIQYKVTVLTMRMMHVLYMCCTSLYTQFPPNSTLNTSYLQKTHCINKYIVFVGRRPVLMGNCSTTWRRCGVSALDSQDTLVPARWISLWVVNSVISGFIPLWLPD